VTALGAVAIALFFCIAQTSATVSADGALTGIGYRNQTDFTTGEVRASMMGGAEIFIRGQGMMSMATSNFPRYYFSGLGVSIDGDALTDNESFMSMPANGKLAISSPSLLDLWGVSWADFDGQGDLETGHSGDTINVEVQITNSDYTEALQCSSSNSCKLKYKRLYTPILHDTVPHQVYAN
jgi:hypothetical protein